MSRQYYWWISSSDPSTGKPYLIFGAPDFGSNGGEDAARSKAFEMLGSIDFTLHRYATRTLSEASAFHRGKRLERGDGLHASSQRLGHERGLALDRRRAARRRTR